MKYLLENPDVVAQRFGEHLALTLTALSIAVLIALPLGLLIARTPSLRGPVLGVLGIIYTIPSLSLLVLLIPLMGLGFWPAVTALVAYAQIILVRNVLIGLTGVEPAVSEAARGMGMSAWQRLVRVELPLALPLIIAGVRVAALAIIGIGTIAAYINAGGLGRLLFEGVTTGNPQKIVAGALAVSALAVGVNLLLWLAERRAARAAYGT
ncbi:MAG: ABC transporter permease [Chloroflexota bacterium]